MVALDNTLKYYAQNTEEFIASPLAADMSAAQEKFLALLNTGSLKGSAAVDIIPILMK